MCKGKMAVLCLVAAVSLVVAGIAVAGIVDPCESYWTIDDSGTAGFPAGNPANNANYFTSPEGNLVGQPDPMLPILSGWGWWISICVIDQAGDPLAAVPASDIWLVDCGPCDVNFDVFFCLGSASSNADSMTNSAGMTTMSTTAIIGGGCTTELAVVVQSTTLLDSSDNCLSDLCCPVDFRSTDINGDGIVNIQDLAAFSVDFNLGAGGDKRSDYNYDNNVNIQDLSRFSFHFGACCETNPAYPNCKFVN